jgi:hypothetical protein
MVLVARSCVALFDAVQRARLNKADVDLRIEVRRLVLEQLKAKPRSVKRGFPTVDVDELIEGATRAAINLERLEVQED